MPMNITSAGAGAQSAHLHATRARRSSKQDQFAALVAQSDLDLSPTGDVDRWWSEQAYGLLEHERAMVADHVRVRDNNAAEMRVWPSWRDESGVRLVGICPHCNRTHIFSLCENPIRMADGKFVRLVVEDGEMPDHVQFAVRAEADDLRNAADIVERHATYFERMQTLRSARKRVGRLEEIRSDILDFALDSLLRSEVVGETLSRAAEGSNDLETLREWVEQQPGKTLGRKLANALKRGELALAHGELL